MPGPPGGPSPFCFLDASAWPVLRVMASGDGGESRADQVPAPGRGLSRAGAGAGAGAVAGVSARARASRLPTAPAPPCAHARAHAHALGSRTRAHARTLAPSVSIGTNVVTPPPPATAWTGRHADSRANGGVGQGEAAALPTRRGNSEAVFSRCSGAAFKPPVAKQTNRHCSEYIIYLV